MNGMSTPPVGFDGRGKPPLFQRVAVLRVVLIAERLCRFALSFPTVAASLTYSCMTHCL